MNRILIAEDEGKIAAFLERGLRNNGFTTLTVSDGESAYDHARSGEFDLLILDIGLPQVDGFTVLRRLREGSVDIPVVILTARDSVRDRVAAASSLSDDELIELARGSEKVQAHLDGKEIRQTIVVPRKLVNFVT